MHLYLYREYYIHSGADIYTYTYRSKTANWDELSLPLSLSRANKFQFKLSSGGAVARWRGGNVGDAAGGSFN